MSEAGALPQGLTWTDNGNGTATLAGTPGVNQGGVYDLSFVAASSNGKATQAFTLTVDQAPAITSGSAAPATHGQAFTFTFTSTGYPLASITHSGSVAGLTFSNKGNGTATLSGTPTKAGTYTLTVTAKNSVGSASQSFTLTVS
jgi:PKD repeat protein